MVYLICKYELLTLSSLVSDNTNPFFPEQTSYRCDKHNVAILIKFSTIELESIDTRKKNLHVHQL
jgi:hypothetical protein